MSKAKVLLPALVLPVMFAAAAAVGGLALAAPTHTSSTVGEARPGGGQTVTNLGEAHPNLTVGECKGLGGKVVPFGGCGSTFACQAVDSNGVVHQACITAAKH